MPENRGPAYRQLKESCIRRVWAADKKLVKTKEEVLLNCKDLRCPMPIVKISLAVRKLATGDRVRVEATDQAFHPDLIAWIEQLGHKLIEYQPGSIQSAVIEKV